MSATRRDDMRYRDIVENARDIILEVDLEDRFTAVNPAFERVLGYTADEVIGQPIESIVAPDWCAQVRDATSAKLLRPKEPTYYDVELLASDGHVVPVEVSSWLVVEDGQPVAVQAILRDVSERLTAERALRDVEEELEEQRGLLQRAFDDTIVGLIFASPDGRIERVNAAFCRLLGYTAEELCALTVMDISHPDDREATRKSLVGLTGGALRRYQNEKRYLAKNGDVIRVQIGVSPVHDGSGEVTAVIAQVLDVTARRDSEERFRRLFESSPQGIAVIDRQGGLLETNAALVRILGYEATELRGRHFTEFAETEDGDFELFGELFTGRRMHFELERRFFRKDGAHVLAHITVFALPDPTDHPSLAIGFLSDVTEERELEDKLRQSQRMEAVGQLAGGVAHDFNNVLTAITSYCDLVATAVGDDRDARANVEGIRSAAARAAEMTQQLLAFSRRQVLELAPIDLNTALRDQSRLLERLLGDDISIRLSLAPDLDAVTMDAGQLGQIVMNLAVNARDAMPDGGVLTIETQNVELDRASTTTGIVSGSFVLLAVSDTGCGMDADTAGRIFEPFFTTKDPGRGTGLGLSTVLGIVEQSGGRLSVYSEPGIGTTFKVYMPSAGAGAPGPDESSPSGARIRPGGTGRILLVEDNESVRRPVARLLADLGYDVVEADGPESALKLAAGDAVDLLVTDVVMPAMNGRQLAERLVAAQPQLKVLYMSGYTDDAVIARGVIEPGTAFLQKPFGADRLAQKIAELLG